MRTPGDAAQHDDTDPSMYRPSPQGEAAAVNEEHDVTPELAGIRRNRHLDGSEATSSRPSNDGRPDSMITSAGSLRLSKRSKRPQLLSQATTAVSLTDINTGGEVNQSLPRDDTQSRTASRRPSVVGSIRAPRIIRKDIDDTSSILSRTSLDPGASILGEIGSLVEEALSTGDDAALDAFTAEEESSGHAQQQDESFEAQFDSEFIELEDLKARGNTEEALMLAWSLKLKHFLILTSAGKPIWSRHGDDQLISNTIGVVQTIISFYQEDDDVLKSFTAGQARFTILSRGHLHLVAISRMTESDGQLRTQLEALYMQVLSTLTLPAMEKHFQNRPSTDLRRPLQGTEKLLDALADGFTRGSPSTLLSSLECLHLRRVHRAAINNAFLKSRCPELLYGLLVTQSGQLVSVLRSKKHSLHPGDLQLVFNMLFEAKSVRAGGGESWVPLCLPGFDSKGYVYMYVSFLDLEPVKATPESSAQSREQPQSPPSSAASVNRSSISNGSSSENDPSLAIILISAQRDAFQALQRARDSLVASVSREPLKTPLTAAIYAPRPSISSLVPGTSSPISLQHFLYKSRTHVQYTLPNASPHFNTALAWRKMMNRYGSLHAIVHGQGHGHGRGGRWYWSVEREGVGAAWLTSEYEIYGLAEQRTSRAKASRALMEIVRWAKKEEERIFVVGGAVF